MSVGHELPRVPRTSVIIPARNAEATLRQTVDSLLRQSDPDWEALIIDDGSTDSTAALIAQYAGGDARIRSLCGPGRGVSAARNLGLAHASGRRLLFLDSDDWIDAHFLELMNAALDGSPDAAAAYCAHQRVMADGQRTPAYKSPQIAASPLAAFARSCATAIHTVLIERRSVSSVCGFDESLRTCEDWDLWQRVARNGGVWVYVDRALSFYRASEHSLSQDVQQLIVDARLVIARGFATADPTVQEGLRGARELLNVVDMEAQAHAFFVLWCAAFDCGRGGTTELAPDTLRMLPSTAEATQSIVLTLFDGLGTGMRVVPRQIAARWSKFGPRLTRFVETLGVLWNDPAAARRIQYGFERLALEFADVSEPCQLSLTVGLRVDLRNLATYTPPAGIDRLYVHFCQHKKVLAILDVWALGTITKGDWLELALSHLPAGLVARNVGATLLTSLTPPRLWSALKRDVSAHRHRSNLVVIQNSPTHVLAVQQNGAHRRSLQTPVDGDRQGQPMMPGRLVSVVIPAYNAAVTLAATLESARSQLHENLEIIVVDDGSTDDTLAIAREHATRDARIQTLSQQNAGLASARNAGWRQARSDLIAFLDADDLWAPTKIQLQLEALDAGGSRVGLVYCGSVRIDAAGVVQSYFPLEKAQGDVLEELFSRNFIGNGSVAMLTREALTYAGGFDSGLREAGAQGCEDYLLQCRVAERFHFATVPEHLVGYRFMPGNMSSDRPRMLRSWMLVVEEMRRRQPGRTAALLRGLRSYATWIACDAVGKRAFAQLPKLLNLIMRIPAPVSLDILLKDFPREAMRRLRFRVIGAFRRTSPNDGVDARLFERVTRNRQLE